MEVRVRALNGAGNAALCFTGTFLIESTDPAAARTSPLQYPPGIFGPSFPYSPVVVGTHTITVRQLTGSIANDGKPLIASASLRVDPVARNGLFWVSSSRGRAGASGSHADPYISIADALQGIPGAVPHPCIRVESGSYSDQPVITRPMTLVGDSVGGCVLRGQAGKDALTVALGGRGSTVRRFTLTGAVQAQDPIVAGLWVYKAKDVTLSNLLIRRNRHGVRLEDSKELRLENLTIVENAGDGLYGSDAKAWVSSSILQENDGCDVFQGYFAGDRNLGLGFDHFGTLPLCRSFDPGVSASSMNPDLLDRIAWTLDLASQRNQQSGLVDGGEFPVVQRDIDGSLRDRGAYGGPWGEVHYDSVLDSDWSPMGSLFVCLAACSVLLLGGRRARKRGGVRG